MTVSFPWRFQPEFSAFFVHKICVSQINGLDGQLDVSGTHLGGLDLQAAACSLDGDPTIASTLSLLGSICESSNKVIALKKFKIVNKIGIKYMASGKVGSCLINLLSFIFYDIITWP